MPKGYIVLVCSVSSSVLPSHSITKFYFEVFLITYNSAATDQKLFIFGMGVPGRTPGSCHRVGLEVKI